jgi:glycosyltransferase involved in cell wall biosynthesis
MEFLLLVDRHLESGDVPDGCREILVGRPYGKPIKRFRDVGARVHSVLWMNVSLPHALRREAVDVLHGTNYALPGRTECRTVSTIHDMISVRVPGAFEPVYQRYMRSLVTRVARQSDHVIADSLATKSDIIELLGVEPDDVSVIHLGVGDEFREPLGRDYLNEVKAKLALPERFVLHVGAIERRKKLETLLDACAPLLRRGALDAVVLAGEEGYGAADVKRAAVKLGIGNSVRYPGYIEQRLLPGLYALAQVLSLASAYEGFGVPAVEAMACGTPVVTSNVSSLPEVVGDAAVTVPPGDSAALARAIESMLVDPDLRRLMVDRGRDRAASFRWTDAAARHVEVYRRVAGQARH